MPNPNINNTVGFGIKNELVKLDEIRQLQTIRDDFNDQGQCCEYISVRFADKDLPYIFAKKQEVTTRVEYFNIGEIIFFYDLRKLDYSYQV